MGRFPGVFEVIVQIPGKNPSCEVPLFNCSGQGVEKTQASDQYSFSMSQDRCGA